MQNVTQGVYDNTQARDVIQEPSDGAVAFSLALWVLTIAVGVPGNALMTITIGYTASLRTAMNTYLLSIGLVDFLTCALLLPLRVYVNHIERTQKVIPHAMHSAELFIRTGTEAARLLLMLSLSVERYQAIARPFSVSKVQASWRALIVSGLTCGAAVLVSALAMHYFCDSVLFIHCLRDDTDYPTRWGTLELYVELPLTIVSVLAIVVSYSLIVVVLRQQSKKMRGHSKSKAKPSQVVPVDHPVDHPVVGVSPLKKDTIRHFIVQAADHNDVSRHTDATVSTIADSDISPVVADNNCDPIHQSPLVSTPVNGESQQEDSCYTKPEVKDFDLSDSKIVRDKLGSIPEVSFALEISLDRDTIFRPLQFANNLPDSIVFSTFESANNKTNNASEDKQILTKALGAGLDTNGLSDPSSSDSPYLSRLPLLQTPSLTCSASDIRDNKTQGKLIRRRSSFHGFVNSFRSSEIFLNTYSELPYFNSNSFIKNVCTNYTDPVSAKTFGLLRNPFRRSKSEVSTSFHSAEKYLRNLLHGEIIFPNTNFLHIGNANSALTNSSIETHSTETPHKIYISDTPNSGSLSNTIGRDSCHSEDPHGDINPSPLVRLTEKRVSNVEQIKDTVDSDDNFYSLQKQKDYQTDTIKETEDFPSKDSEATIFLNEHFDRNFLVTTTIVGAEETINQEDFSRCPASLEERIKKENAVSVECKSDMDNVQRIMGLDTEANRDIDANHANHIVQKSNPASVPIMENTTSDTTGASGKTEEAKLVEVVEMDGTVRIEVQPGASAKQFDGAVCLMNPRNKEQGRRRVELKAALKVGLLFCTYVCLWAPLPVLVVYMRETYGWREKLKLDLLVMFSSLATSTAAVDPIIYGLLNRQIRSAAVVVVKKFKKKLRERFRSAI